MKRKRAECSENSEPPVLQDNTDKRRKLNSNSGKSWSTNRKEVEPELLEDLGVNIIEDASNDSTSEIPVKAPSIDIVLKTKDQNIRKTTQTCSDLNISAGTSSSFVDFDSSFDSTDSFIRYNRSRSRPGDRTVQLIDVFNTLSDEVVLNVFKWLPKSTLSRCSLVCKRWRRLVKDESLWKRVDLGLRNILPGVVGEVLSRGCTILRLSRSTLISPLFKFAALPTPTFCSSRLSKLVILDLSMANAELDCLEDLFKTCRQLKKLGLERCLLSDEACRQIGKNSNLEVLHLALTEGWSDGAVGLMFSGLTQLTELNISWTDVSEAGLGRLVGLLPPSLERLNLAGYRSSLQDAHIEELVTQCRNIRELDVSDATVITSAALNLIADNLLKLESLSTSRCYAISPTSYLILIHCPSLLHLNVYGLLKEHYLVQLREQLSGISLNSFPLSSIARPTVGIKRTSLWNLRVRDVV